MVNFVLESLNSSVTMGVAGNLFSEPIPVLDVSATAILYVSIDDMKSVFQFQTDSTDVNNLANADIKYYVDTASWPVLNPMNAMMNISSLSQGAIALIDSNGALADNKLMVCHDFTRYLASKLFGTHFGTDLFNNETELLQDLRLIADGSAEGHTWYDIVAKVTAVSKSGTHEGLVEDANGDKYMTNATNDNTNLCRVLFDQMIGSAVSRFQDISLGADQAQALPFQVDDAISFVLTVAPAEGQEELTGVDAFGARTYEIRFVIKDSADVANTEVAADEE
jgi:hypothetical protein